MRRLCALGTTLALAAFGVGATAAQQPDTVRADTLPPSRGDLTTKYLEAQARAEERLPVLPYIGVDGPRPPLSRIVLVRDSIDFLNAATVADLLQRVPGVYLWRGGWIGRPEYPNYQGRGPASVEYLLDGVPYLPVGPDSVGVDPSTLPMSFLERVEIERWPGLLRVYLFTRRNESPAARSRVAVASGDRNIARYEGALETRSPRGPGLVLAGEYLSVGLGSAPGITDYSNTHYWLQGSWQRSARFGLMYQLVQQSPGRRLLIRAAGDTIGGSLKGKRSDALGRVFLQTRADGTGPRLDLLYGRTSWSGGTVDQLVSQGGLAVSFHRPTYQLGGSAMLRSQWTTLDLRGHGGWTPLPQLSASGEIVHQEHDGGRQSDWVGVRGGLSLPLALSLSGAARVGKAVAAPALLGDVAQDLRDYSATLSWQQRVVGFELGVNRTAAFAPQAYQSFLRVDSLRPLPATTWVTASVRIQPQPWITLESWYSNASTGTPDGIPPHHSLTTGTIHSNFLRQFPSGILDLKLQMAAEAFSSGIIGLGGAGQPIPIGGATFYRSLVEVRLGGFVAYWDRVNLRGERRGYVPGYDFPALGSTYGVRWEFVN